jgi:hypothetical protein
MAAIIQASIDVSKLPKEKFVKGKKGVWYNFTISVNDDTKYGNNVSLSDSQTKEEREAGKPRDYLGNGKVIWTNGSITKAESEVQPVATTTGSVEDLF